VTGYFRRILLSVSLLILVFFIIFLINQTAQVVQLATGIHPLLGQITLWGLLIIYLILISIPVYFYFRLPGALQPPENDHSAEYTLFLEQLAKRLKKNANLQGQNLSNRREIEQAVKTLDEIATQKIRKSATTVFVTTAISQSGRLDAFTVLIAQIRMVWQVAIIYYQRPSARALLQLYANVAATAFVAGELNDLDISEQVEPVITGVLGGTLGGAIPGVSTVAGIITNSLLTGSANAFLTLRIGAIAKQYCGALTKKERRLIRRSATAEAARMLSVIIMNSAGNISKAIVNAAVRSPGKLSRSVLRSTWGKFSGKSKTEANFPNE